MQFSKILKYKQQDLASRKSNLLFKLYSFTRYSNCSCLGCLEYLPFCTSNHRQWCYVYSIYITSVCAQRLRLARKKCSFESLGLGGNPVQDFGFVTCSIKLPNSLGFIPKTKAIVLSQITGNLPTITLSSKSVNEFRNLDLADPFNHTAASVELLIANILPSVPGLPVAMHSIFGCVITSQTVINTNDQRQTTSCILQACGSSIYKVIKSFWEIENISCDLSPNPEDVYRFSQNEPLKVYELNTLTYGNASRPCLSIKVLHLLIDDSMKNYPTVSAALMRVFSWTTCFGL
nr:unnamed protein product [Callosobruchus analis]